MKEETRFFMDQMNPNLYENDRKVLSERLFKSREHLDPNNPLSDAESDDEHVRKSWTTEKQLAIVFPAPIEIKMPVQEVLAENNQSQEKELIGSYGSFDWSTGNTSFDKEEEEVGEQEETMEYSNQHGHEEHEEHEEHEIDKALLEKVDAALHILNDEEHLFKSSEWKLNYTEEGKPFYVDSNAWQVDGSIQSTEEDDQQLAKQQPENPEQNVEESLEKTEIEAAMSATAEAVQENNDEWREAYTAKGRVYYYNRCTRESSWKKPSSFVTSATTTPDGTTTSSTADSNMEKESQTETKDIEIQNHLFCTFCGTKCLPQDMKTHLNEVCTCAIHHQSKRTSLFKQFEEMLLILSEQPALRSLHYATSTPVVVSNRFSHQNDNDQEEVEVEDISLPASSVSPDVRQGPASIQASLSLLRQHGEVRRSTRKQQETSEDNDEEDQTSYQPHRPSSASSSRLRAPTKRETISSRYQNSVTHRKTSVSMTALPSNNSSNIGGAMRMEQCRHCHRRFAEGRVAKHEAVCPRVFGGASEPSSSSNLSLSQQHQLIARQLQQQRRRSSVPTYQKKKPLALSFKDHQATLVPCPCCHRKFHPSGVKQHVDICQTVQNRPRPKNVLLS